MFEKSAFYNSATATYLELELSIVVLRWLGKPFTKQIVRPFRVRFVDVYVSQANTAPGIKKNPSKMRKRLFEHKRE